MTKKPKFWWQWLDRLYARNHGERRCWYCGRTTRFATYDGSVMCNPCWKRT